jgi:hypothetical protein
MSSDLTLVGKFEELTLSLDPLTSKRLTAMAFMSQLAISGGITRNTIAESLLSDVVAGLA